MRQRERGLGSRGLLEYDPGKVGHFHYRQVLGVVALASSEKTVLVLVLEVNVCVAPVGRAQMTDTDVTQVAPGSGFLARPVPSKRRSEWFYNL